MRPAFFVILVAVLMGCNRSENVEYSVPGLVTTLKESKDPNLRYWAAESLGRLGHQARPAVPALAEALKDEDKNVRMGAAYALAELGPDARDALHALQAAARDPEKQVRDAAAYALKRGRGPK